MGGRGWGVLHRRQIWHAADLTCMPISLKPAVLGLLALGSPRLTSQASMGPIQDGLPPSCWPLAVSAPDDRVFPEGALWNCPVGAVVGLLGPLDTWPCPSGFSTELNLPTSRDALRLLVRWKPAACISMLLQLHYAPDVLSSSMSQKLPGMSYV